MQYFYSVLPFRIGAVSDLFRATAEFVGFVRVDVDVPIRSFVSVGVFWKFDSTSARLEAFQVQQQTTAILPAGCNKEKNTEATQKKTYTNKARKPPL